MTPALQGKEGPSQERAGAVLSKEDAGRMRSAREDGAVSTHAFGGDARPVLDGRVGTPVGISQAHATRPPAQTVLTLLGSWSLWSGGSEVAATASEQRLVALLALRGRQRRSYLAGVLWADALDRLGLTRLRNTLSSLRRRCPQLLETSEDTVALRRSVIVDVEELEAGARELAEGRGQSVLVDRYLDLLIGSSELLLGWYEDWIVRERDRLNELRIRALERLVDELLRARRYAEASEAAIAAIQLDPLRESSHRALMRVYVAEGNPALASRQVERYRDILRSELGTSEPTREMIEIVS
jgi:DNA-binding SARP family transcriptional activator